MGGLPCAGDDFPDPAHGLRVRRHNADGPHVVQDIFRGNGLATDAGFRKRHVFRNPRVQVVAHDQHVQMLIHRVHGKRHRGVGRGRHTFGSPQILMMSGA